MLAEYARGKESFRIGRETKQKRPNEQWGLKSIYDRPTSNLLYIPQ